MSNLNSSHHLKHVKYLNLLFSPFQQPYSDVAVCCSPLRYVHIGWRLVELELTELVHVCVNQWPYTALDMTHMQCLMVCNCVFIKVSNCTLSKILNSKTVFSSFPGDLMPTPGYCNLWDLKKIKTVTSKVGKIPHRLLILTSASKL